MARLPRNRKKYKGVSSGVWPYQPPVDRRSLDLHRPGRVAPDSLHLEPFNGIGPLIFPDEEGGLRQWDYGIQNDEGGGFVQNVSEGNDLATLMSLLSENEGPLHNLLRLMRRR